ncbi:MAG TPA: hypothetical protein DEG17_11630 [Cyanobacteria bacterium UBA11149]|nr:hypothetical protein [Cyanobacteria bacterium UBA11367]HBE59755.1 hypothetical protein [Cyanobacteria bacterium UBA11366]HBK62076.1 hypothetical protein [Cyanobacteria bacterium UBA11166]HBR74879.1 hypothetical protein [Cyanobacteria bacterium UBA11159]HBS70887.1 hypothetical protein [Cyanobacteria bacterium UBA11153]HBW89498.1 hypothetical protein [Cyanobacteria bacterium UBA11149]HCA94961.1 hypothetical protein [Cyanobacteria bacterium UBA9226]
MNIWQDILTTALVGTERKTLTPIPPTNQLSQLLSQLNYRDPEGTLLSAAAIISLYQKAEQISVIDNQTLPTPSQNCDLSICSPLAAEYLKVIFLKERLLLLSEWLTTAAAAKKQVPAYSLPELLELGRTSPHLRLAIMPVLGKRGRWLAAQNPQWDYVVGEDIEITWQTGSNAARQLLFQQIRTENPAAAREKLIKIWAEEKSEEKLGFLQISPTGLNKDDEPFLEAALDDKSPEVRQKAAELLAHLPESRLCQRMATRVTSALIIKQNRHRLHLDFNLSHGSDEGMLRDGIDSKNSPKLLGKKAWQILQIVAATPLSLWSQINDISPIEWIQAAKRSEWDRTLVDGWVVAALRQKNPEWAEVLLSMHHNFNGYLVNHNQSIQGLINALPPQRQDTFFIKFLQENKTIFDTQNSAFSLLRHYRYPWSHEFTMALIDTLAYHLKRTTNPYDWTLRSAFQDFACYIPLSLVPVISVIIPKIVPKNASWASFWIEAIDDFMALLNFRVEMMKELRY